MLSLDVLNNDANKNEAKFQMKNFLYFVSEKEDVTMLVMYSDERVEKNGDKKETNTVKDQIYYSTLTYNSIVYADLLTFIFVLQYVFYLYCSVPLTSLSILKLYSW